MSLIYPVNAGQLLDSEYRGKDVFFLLCQWDAARRSLTIDADSPILVNQPNEVKKPEDDIRARIVAQGGPKLPTRGEFSNKRLPDDLSGNHAWPSFYTGAAGAALWFQIGNGEPELLLIKNSKNKPVNRGKFNFPSGLLVDEVHAQAFRETNEESGVFIADSKRRVLTGLNFNLFPGMPSLSDGFRKAVLGVRAEQEQNIRAQLQERYPEMAGWPIEWKTVEPEPMEGKHRATLICFGKETAIRAHVFPDQSANSVNVHFPYLIKLPAGVKIITLDPEQFGRYTGLYGARKTRSLYKVPSVIDYTRGLSLYS